MQRKNASADELISFIISGIEEVKGLDINLLDLGKLKTPFATIS